jgi:hypothetical protein
LTARVTIRAGTVVDYSDPIFIIGNSFDQRIKGTLGITGLYPFRDLIDGGVWHLDVGLLHPEAEEGFNGLTVRQ